MDVLNAHGLLATATELCQRLQLSRVGSQKLDRHVPLASNFRCSWKMHSPTCRQARRWSAVLAPPGVRLADGSRRGRRVIATRLIYPEFQTKLRRLRQG